ncbi:aspartyl/asparaginyl beta-hydroxylase domain-containing protein [Luteolibacter yonseiensis]|uniref:Aspartyl/asparaginyl beta-hydroxylase domain-containing protein n=1 Tax=Luteolibacter yonseiensis TaxID=1144680 RepID=A0A934RAJ4_9BACT|nr:aspartyl/asparaginyl beta-hydroxylase domain-containing protein [Luteolibacter yonseiensis]MBK1818029.1 aspartyl/asparaginyl beta-hydroxylase domain-containing protein [Luteolibacter yonseiensis]
MAETHPIPPKAARLPLNFDPAALQEDLAALGSGEWVAHFNTGFFSGDWSGAALRAVAGSANAMVADTHQGEFSDTTLLGRCNHLRGVVESFKCPLRSVRLLRLTAGSNIREHRDYDLGYDAGEVRVHVPVITNPGVEFFLDGKRIIMNEGECWYLDLNRPHRVRNRGESDRIHLVIDCQLNDWLRGMIAEATPDEGSESGFEPFRRLVLSESAMQEELGAITDRGIFLSHAVELGRKHGFDFLEDDVEAALQDARRKWMERWIA